MNRHGKTQQGASAIGILIVLAILGIGVYIGLQYIPQYIEAGTVDSILANLEQTHSETPFTSTMDVRNSINRQLDLNQLNELRDSFRVSQDGEAFIVQVSYERELNLIYEKRPMPYENRVTLR